jgi:hypothetical protein
MRTTHLFRNIKDFSEFLRSKGIEFINDESKILIWANVKSVSFDTTPTMILTKDDTEITIEDLLITKTIVIKKQDDEHEIILGKNFHVMFEYPYLILDYKQQPGQGNTDQGQKNVK